MKRNYDECVTKYSDSFVRVVLDPGYVSRIQNFVTELVEAKSKEDHHKIDSNKEVKRFTTGFLGEAALEKLFGIPIIDWTIGYSGLYHIPDIPGYRVGIKTVERDKFPIIFKDNSYPQIICIKSTSGIYGYPKDEALQVATTAITKFIGENDIDVYLAVFDKTAFQVSEELMGEVASYIDEHYIDAHDFRRRKLLDVEKESILEANAPVFGAMSDAMESAESLEELVDNLDEPFSDTLLKLIDAKGKTDVEVYKKANIDRKLFSKIRSIKGYTPKKPTIIVLAIALELSLDETDDLLERAGYALSCKQV